MIGSRYVPGGAIVNWPLRRRLLSRFANTLHPRGDAADAPATAPAATAAGGATRSPRCRSTRFISDGYSFLVEMLFVAARRGCRIAEVPITFVERRQGESKLSRAVLLESALTPWRLVGARTVVALPPAR